MAIQPLQAADESKIALALEVLTKMADSGDSPDSVVLSLATLDEIWTKKSEELWQDESEYVPEDLIEQIGIGIGQHLVSNGGCQWGFVTDEYGTDLCVHKKTSDGSVVTVCPISLTAKRWHSKTAPFIVATIDAIVDQVWSSLEFEPLG